MPRKPRFYVSGVPAHVIQRGNNRQPIFFEEADYQKYLKWLKEACKKYSCSLHCYTLMTNHVHLLISSEESDAISKMMQYVGRFYVPYVNRKYKRSGTLWEGRYKASLIEEKIYFLVCMRYIELNPVRAGIVAHPRVYKWSSYLTNAENVEDPFIVPHQQYLALGHSDNERKECYRELFLEHIKEETLYEIRAALQTGTPLGDERFRDKIEDVLKQKVGFNRRGRPKQGKGL